MTGKQLVQQGCYAVAWVGIEPTTFELQGRTLSIDPRRPVNVVDTAIKVEHLTIKFTTRGFHMAKNIA